MTTIDWNEQLVEQIDWHWRSALRPRLESLSDAEYSWEPAPGCWSVRPRGTSSAPVQAGAGPMTIDFAMPQPEPPPLTTIFWRLGHLVVDVLAARNTGHFGAPPAEHEHWEHAAGAEEALAQLDTVYDAWITGVRSLGTDGLLQPCGHAEGPFAAEPMAMLVLHISRELIHHGAEIALLRDLYRAREGAYLVE